MTSNLRHERPTAQPMPAITVRPKPEDLRRWKEAAAREGLTLREWLHRAADLAVARGSTR